MVMRHIGITTNSARGFMSNDNWQTPQWLFNSLNEEFNFTVDLCASHYNHKCDRFYSETNSLLTVDPVALRSDICFMNPPYSRNLIKPCIEKAWQIAQNASVVCLLKVDTSTRWWSIFWDYENHMPKHGCKIRFFPKRVKFDPPPNVNGKSGPAFPTCVVIMDRRDKPTLKQTHGVE